MIDTSESLLDRLKVSPAEEAWREFYHLYWATILRYAQKLGLSEHEAEDVLQETMVVLIRLLPAFSYNRERGRFRNFLLTIVHRKTLARLRRASRRTEVTWDELTNPHSHDPFGNEATLAEEARVRWQEAILEEAVRRVREAARSSPETFAAFEAYVLQRRPAAEVAREFGLKENAVYQIRNRILRRVQNEIVRLTRSAGEEAFEWEP